METKPKVTRETEADQQVMEAVRAKMIELLTGPLTPGSLATIERMARHAKGLIASGRRQAMGVHVGDDDDGTFTPWSPIAGAPASETFGATLVREAVPLLAEMLKRDKTNDLVVALATARKEGLADIAEGLERRLREVAPPASVPEAPSSPNTTETPVAA